MRVSLLVASIAGAGLLVSALALSGTGYADSSESKGPGVVVKSANQIAQANAAAIVKERKDLMKSNSRNYKEIRKAVRAGKVGTNEVDAAAKIRANIQKFTTLFPAGTSSDDMKNRAKPAIWKDFSGFQAKAKDLAEKAAAVETAAKSGDVAAAAASLKALDASCDGCHRSFRGPRPK